ncbi:MAG: hypothetical protein CMJ78_07710 [Planctomycetaceae bacterium]|nr:hypothetical protein [Planctomycetaceae bacterium]
MKRATILVPMIVLCMMGTVYALSIGGPGGAWPKDSPKQLEALRKRAWTWLHGRYVRDRGQFVSYEIPFKDRDEFEAAWPHILKFFKAKGTKVTLVRGNHIRVSLPTSGSKSAGVRIMGLVPVDALVARSKIDGPASHQKITVTDIQLVVDGKIVDLNRIRLPANTTIEDRRFPQK